MTTALEIEAAIRRLPLDERRKLDAWREDERIMLECADRLFQMYDREEEEQELERKAGKSA